MYVHVVSFSQVVVVHEMYTLLGIGTFDNSIDEEYLEIMKELAYLQYKLTRLVVKNGNK